MIDFRRIAHGAMTNGISGDFFDLGGTIAKGIQRRGNRMVDDFEISTARQFLEFHQCKIRLDPGGVTIHHQTDGAGWGHNGNLRVAIPVLFAQSARASSQTVLARFHQRANRDSWHDPGALATRPIPRSHQSHQRRRACDCGSPATCDRRYAAKPVKRAQLLGHFGRGGIRNTGHDRA